MEFSREEVYSGRASLQIWGLREGGWASALMRKVGGRGVRVALRMSTPGATARGGKEGCREGDEVARLWQTVKCVAGAARLSQARRACLPHGESEAREHDACMIAN